MPGFPDQTCKTCHILTFYSPDLYLVSQALPFQQIDWLAKIHNRIQAGAELGKALVEFMFKLFEDQCMVDAMVKSSLI